MTRSRSWRVTARIRDQRRPQVHPLPHQQRLVRMRLGKIAEGGGQRIKPAHPFEMQMRQFGTAQNQMQMAFDKARQHRAPGGVDDGGLRPGQRPDFAIGADGGRR